MNVSKSPRHTSCSTSPDKIDSTEKDSISIPPSIPPPPPSLIKAQLSSSRSVASNIDEGFALLDVSICNQSQFCFTLKTLRLTVGRGPLATPEAYLFIQKLQNNDSEMPSLCRISALHISSFFKLVSKRHFRIYWDFVSQSWILNCCHKNGITINRTRINNDVYLPSNESTCLSMSHGDVILIWNPAKIQCSGRETKSISQ